MLKIYNIQDNWFAIGPLTINNFIFLQIVFLLLTGIVAKWLDITKYQETWNRHQNHKYKLDMEMFKYIQEKAPYYDRDKRKAFSTNIMKIWGENQEQFYTNIKNEAVLLDLTDQIKLLRK